MTIALLRLRAWRRGLALLLVASCAPAARVEIEASRFLDDVRILSSARMRGRGTGTQGLDRAAHYIAAEFRKAGLRPVPGKSYFQPFQVSTASKLGTRNRVSWSLAGRRQELKLHEQVVPFPFSGSGRIAGAQAVFAGYGITAREYDYDDYAGIDARGKIVVVLRHEPQEFESSSLFEGRIYTEHSQLLSKAMNALEHGARAIVYVNDTANHTGNALEKFASLAGPADPGLPFVQVHSDVVEQWFAAAQRDFKSVQEAIDRDVAPQSFAFPDDLRIHMDVELHQTTRVVNNVAAYVPGTSDEYIVVGAHYDHLGLGEQYSLATNAAGKPHPGADDNASGTAGLLALARSFSAQPKLRRGILFIAFAGEELGLLGSTHYVRNPLLPLQRAALMINMDMIGRMRDGKLIVGGVATGTGLADALQQLAKPYAFDVEMSDRAVYGSSDHTSFMTRLIPVLFFFTGLHPDYHRPTDTWDKIDARSASRLLELVGEVIAEFAIRNERPGFVKPATAGRGNSATSPPVD